MEKLINSFDKIFIINLDSRVDRLNDSLNILNQYNIENKYERFSAITPPPDFMEYNDNKGRKISKGAYGLILSLYEIIKLSKEKKYKSILVLEDDFLFKNEEYSDLILTQLNNLKWDVFYFGANLHEKLTPIDKNIYKIKHGYATHAVAYSENFYDYFLSNFNNNNIKILDVWLSDYAQNELNCFCSWPILSIQRPSYSDIENKFTNYDWMEKNYNKNTKGL
jgi:GR25 family glycosyltransferase involved in LPS biosynthesis